MNNSTQDPDALLRKIADEDIKYVDLRFTDPAGTWEHVTLTAECLDEDAIEDGVMFDGSSIAGWKAINESDMALMPDASFSFRDPFYAEPTLAVVCDVSEPGTGAPYGRDPRSTARKAVAYLQQTGIGDNAFFGPEAEFFVFDDVRFEVQQNRVAYELDSEEGPYNSATRFEMGNMGHRPGPKGGYFPVNPVDSCQDLRSEMLSTLTSIGVPVEKHHHEVAPAQHELGMIFGEMLITADRMQAYKYVVKNVAAAYGKTATFMPH